MKKRIVFVVMENSDEKEMHRMCDILNETQQQLKKEYAFVVSRKMIRLADIGEVMEALKKEAEKLQTR